MKLTSKQLAQYIDHTLLKPVATAADFRTLCQEAKEYNFKTVCVNPWAISLCKNELKNAQTKVITVVGFPLGANTTESKFFETEQAVALGAEEVDMVINIGALKSKNHDFVTKDIQAVVQAAHDKPVKVILETTLLTDEEKRIACQLSEKAGAQFVKTSTGFAGGGATIEDVKLMRASVSAKVLVKASGGIKNLEQALAMIEAGADRIGCSSSVEIIKEAQKRN